MPNGVAGVLLAMFDFEILGEALPSAEGTGVSRGSGASPPPPGVVAAAAAPPSAGGDDGGEVPEHASPPSVPMRPKRPVVAAWSQLVDKLSHSVGLQGRALEVLRLVDRGDFVLPGSSAYDDKPQRIGHNATISAPHMHAMALRLLVEQLRPGCRVLDVGSGSGFLSTVMAHLVGPGPSGLVIGIDYLEPLVRLAKTNVANNHPELLEGASASLRLEVGDGWKGCAQDGPFDAIHVGAAASELPHALVQQLKPGGRMVIPVGQAGRTQAFMQVDKDSQGRISEQRLIDVMYVPLVHPESNSLPA